MRWVTDDSTPPHHYSYYIITSRLFFGLKGFTIPPPTSSCVCCLDLSTVSAFLFLFIRFIYTCISAATVIGAYLFCIPRNWMS